MIGLTKSLGKELADTEIRVNCVTPAAVKTPLFDQMTPAADRLDAVENSHRPVRRHR